ncbi:MAG: glycoside hydrolase family 99-like domain-containing protein [Bacteroidetes bacterium]|nr:glycoside hydrolase family 99-like domain-containing protein [Bacteroidota bacterium]
MNTIRPIAIYLPQYHTIPENDQWWGKGFTEWHNVKRAKPQVINHYQPHIPVDNIYYNLRDPDVRQLQATIAKQHGIYGFCYYHYWFNGKRLLNFPIDEQLRTHRPAFPFCLAWANEDWTRAWDGASGEILINQTYNHSDDLDHIRFLCTVFQDPEYIRVDGKPVFIIYKPVFFPDIQKTLEIWREEAIRLGIGDLYLCYFENEIQKVDPQTLGFDAAIEFQPNWWNLPPLMSGEQVEILIKDAGEANNWNCKHKFFNYSELAELNILSGRQISFKRYRCVVPMWDNTARRMTDATIFLNATPENYAFWLQTVLHDFHPFSTQENFVFINAWNEWGEGNHLEPCKKWGYSYLEATKKALLTE